jgi:hypothetical protein
VVQVSRKLDGIAYFFAPLLLEGHLVAEQFALVRGERPVLGEFIRVPVLLHGRRRRILWTLGYPVKDAAAALWLPLPKEEFQSQFSVAFGQHGLDRAALQLLGQHKDGGEPLLNRRDLRCQPIHFLPL